MNHKIYNRLKELDRIWIKSLEDIPTREDFEDEKIYLETREKHLADRRKTADEAFDLISADYNKGDKLAAAIWDHIVAHYSDRWFTTMYKYFLTEAKLVDKVLEIANDDRRDAKRVI